MCSLCGILGCDDHWSSAVARSGVYSRNTGRLTRRREAAERRRIVNRILATRQMRMDDWQGTSYVLSTATGQVKVFDALSHLWPEAEALSHGSFDPLDPVLLQKLRAGA
jgi:hypothetical protein